MKKQCLTWIEILIAIVILLMMIAMLLPVLHKYRIEHRHGMDLKQLEQSVMEYSNAN
jgi:Tfp pilus assembly protein FimT